MEQAYQIVPIPEVDSAALLGVQLVYEYSADGDSLGDNARAECIKNPPYGISEGNPLSLLPLLARLKT